MALKVLARVTAGPFWRRAVYSRQWLSTSAHAAVNDGGRRFEDMPTERGSSWLFGAGPDILTTPQPVFYRKMKEKHGKVFRLKIGLGKYMVVVADVDGAETVIRNEGKYPSRGQQFDALNLVTELYGKHHRDSPSIALSAA